MKKSILFIIFNLLVMTSATVFAQDKTFNFGVKATAGMSGFSHNFTGMSDDTRQSWEGGVMLRANIPVVPLYLQTELNYTNTGGTFEMGEQSQDLVLNRVEVPLLLGGKLGIGGINARAFGGVVAQQVVIDNFSDLSPELDPEKFGLGWQVGVGVDIKKFTIDAKYQQSANLVSNADTSLKSQQFMVSVGYFIW
ncbi:outer membrane beta-barrel protein [Flammeovirga aprica]|uniref:Porin family protein n=1 Tax=Flammeovirga aprica JL-4 TaxID=694437 RepID=A0A7X9XA04_9BACT|nr:outer membrane beta-barrel protein [Flammeovirga aprica]NME69206.1 porin family protein [Flammeovirga aprica JL-4]